jgi:phosphomevalonate kinase
MSSATVRVPLVVLLFCGKRKSGKDHTVKLLQQELQSEGHLCDVLRLSEPLKSDFAKSIQVSENMVAL